MKFFVENIWLFAIALVSGGMLLWPLVTRGMGGMGGGGQALDTLTATRLINDGAVVIDVREAGEFASGHLPNARNIPVSELEKRAAEVPANKTVLVCCATGQRTGKAIGVLRKVGREKVYSLAGGLQAWRQAGLPIVK